MAYKITSVILRSFALALVVLGFFFNSEGHELTRFDHFIMLGVCGGLSIVVFGILLESGLQVKSDKCLEVTFLVVGICLNLLSAIMSFIDFYSAHDNRRNEIMNIGMISILCIIFHTIDVVLLSIK